MDVLKSDYSIMPYFPMIVLFSLGGEFSGIRLP
jgi:hypothetical protein